MALLAFWVLDVSTFIFILYAFEYIAGGHLFPLDVLPRPQSGAALTPFRTCCSFRSTFTSAA